MENELSPAEKSDPLLGFWESQMKPNGPIYEPIPRQDGECSKTSPTGLLSGLKQWARRWAIPSVVLNLILIVTILILIIIVVLAQSATKTPRCPPDVTAACPDGWVGYDGKCYYFSETEGNWSTSQSNCSALKASLASIDSLPELNFMLRYKGIPYHWIGLHRERDQEQPWEWTNGTIFNNLFEIRGEGQCAYLNELGVSSFRCYSEIHFICNRPDECSRRKQGASGGDTKPKIT